MSVPSYSVLLEHLGPLPTIQEVGYFLGQQYQNVYSLVGRGELESVRSSAKLRIPLNSLREYLGRQEALETKVVRRNQVHRAAISEHLRYKLEDVKAFEEGLRA